MVVAKALDADSGRTRFLVRCDCGMERILLGADINRTSSKFSKCTCGKNKLNGLGSHPLYRIWTGIKTRCYNNKRDEYRLYGARGVRVCDSWLHDFKAFYDWAMANGWQNGKEIDKDIKGNGLLYSPDTCLIVDPVVNYRASRQTKLTVDQAAEIRRSRETGMVLSNRFGVCLATIYHIKNGRTWKHI